MAKMWPIKETKKQTAAHIVANSYPLQQAAGMHRYGSLFNINPFDMQVVLFMKESSQALKHPFLYYGHEEKTF